MNITNYLAKDTVKKERKLRKKNFMVNCAALNKSRDLYGKSNESDDVTFWQMDMSKPSLTVKVVRQ